MCRARRVLSGELVGHYGWGSVKGWTTEMRIPVDKCNAIAIRIFHIHRSLKHRVYRPI